MPSTTTRRTKHFPFCRCIPIYFIKLPDTPYFTARIYLLVRVIAVAGSALSKSPPARDGVVAEPRIGRHRPTQANRSPTAQRTEYSAPSRGSKHAFDRGAAAV